MACNSSIYFVRAGRSGPVKIGLAKDVSLRIKMLQSGCPQKIKLIGTVPGDRSDEKRFHLAFSKYKLRGEWFLLDRDGLKKIKDICLSASTDDSFTPLKKWRHGRNRPLSWLAAKTGISECSLFEIETGKKLPSFQAVITLNKLTGVPMEEFAKCGP